MLSSSEQHTVPLAGESDSHSLGSSWGLVSLSWSEVGSGRALFPNRNNPQDSVGMWVIWWQEALADVVGKVSVPVPAHFKTPSVPKM